MKTFFTPGPSQLYPTVPKHIQQALAEHIPSLSHRSAKFQAVAKETLSNLRELLNIPDDYQIFFLSSATEAMERVIENCVEKKSAHLIAGSFGKKWYEIAQDLKKDASIHQINLTNIFTNNFTIEPDTELICLTQNETSNGWTMPVKHISDIKKQYPKALIAVDIVSSAPYVSLDYDPIDLAFFSVQKGFGLPAGLGILIVSPRAFAKAQDLHQKGSNIGSYHNFISLAKNMRDFQTPETPNVLAIFLLNQVLKDFLQKGINIIRQETESKANLLYQLLSTTSNLRPAIPIPAHRSQTVIVAAGERLPELLKHLAAQGLIVGKGYGKAKETEIRIANFPGHNKEQLEYLIKSIERIYKLF